MTHTMTLLFTDNAVERWHCFECGRDLAITWEPWTKITIEEGDLSVAHTGGKGGLVIGGVNVSAE